MNITKNLKLSMLFVVGLFSYKMAMGQQEPQYTQFMYNKLQIISAYILHFDPVSAENKQIERSIEMIGTVDTKEIRNLLLEMGYQIQDWTSEEIQKEYNLIMEDDEQLDLEDEVQEVIAPKKLFRVYEKDLSRLGYQLPW